MWGSMTDVINSIVTKDIRKYSSSCPFTISACYSNNPRHIINVQFIYKKFEIINLTFSKSQGGNLVNTNINKF